MKTQISYEKGNYRLLGMVKAITLFLQLFQLNHLNLVATISCF
jgi:hypothetical protein